MARQQHEDSLMEQWCVLHAHPSQKCGVQEGLFSKNCFGNSGIAHSGLPYAVKARRCIVEASSDSLNWTVHYSNILYLVRASRVPMKRAVHHSERLYVIDASSLSTQAVNYSYKYRIVEASSALLNPDVSYSCKQSFTTGSILFTQVVCHCVLHSASVASLKQALYD